MLILRDQMVKRRLHFWHTTLRGIADSITAIDALEQHQVSMLTCLISSNMEHERVTIASQCQQP